MRYGIMDHEGTAHTTPFTVWSGAFASNREGWGTARHGARSVTIHREYGGTVRVVLPEGVTFPRTDKNYLAIDAAINAAMRA